MYVQQTLRVVECHMLMQKCSEVLMQSITGCNPCNLVTSSCVGTIYSPCMMHREQRQLKTAFSHFILLYVGDANARFCQETKHWERSSLPKMLLLNLICSVVLNANILTEGENLLKMLFSTIFSLHACCPDNNVLSRSCVPEQGTLYHHHLLLYIYCSVT